MCTDRTFLKVVGALAISAGLWATTASAQPQLTSVTLSDIRGMKFCEFLLVFSDHVEIYNTSNANGCPDATFAAIDVDQLAKDHGAQKAQLNGPHFWAMDTQTLGLGERKTFGGIEADYAATLPLSALGSGKGADPYKPYTSAKLQTMIFNAGKPVYELTDPDGNTYVLNAYGAEVKDGDPANLAQQLSPAAGWSFSVEMLTDEMKIEGTSDKPVGMVGDDLHQYYTRTGDSG